MVLMRADFLYTFNLHDHCVLGLSSVSFFSFDTGIMKLRKIKWNCLKYCFCVCVTWNYNSLLRKKKKACCCSITVMSNFLIPWTAAFQAFLSFTMSQSFLRLMSIESVMPSNHLILCHPLLLLPAIFPNKKLLSH